MRECSRDGMKELDATTISRTLEKSHIALLTTDDFVDALQSPLAHELSPWEFWALVCFLRHERRQQWVGFLVESRLHGQGVELGTLGALGHPEGVPQEGDVPDEPGWRYFFHGCGCCFTFKDGTSIDVDFADDGSAREIDRFFYSRYLESVLHPEWCESQLRREPPFENAWQFELDRLADLQFITKERRFRLTDTGRAWAEAIEPLVDRVDELSRNDDCGARRQLCWLLLKLGDAVGAAREAEHAQLSDAQRLIVAGQIQLDQRAAGLRSRMRTSDSTLRRKALESLSSLDRKYVEPDLRALLLKQPASSDTHFALDVIISWNDVALELLLVDAVKVFSQPRGIWGLLNRFVPSEPDEQRRPRLGVLVKLCRTLLSRHSPKTLPAAWSALVESAMRGDCFACDAEAGMLLCFLDPEAGLAKLESTLGHQVPITREEAAAFLGIIGSESAIEILCRTAQGTAVESHEAACVLSLLTDDRANQAAARWQRKHDGYEEAEGTETEFAGRKIRTWTTDEVSRVNMRSSVQYQFEKLSARFRPMLHMWCSVTETAN